MHNRLRVLNYNLYQDESGEQTLLWKMVGNQGNKWLTARVSARPGIGRQIIFEGVIGENDFGDIAIDDISRYLGYCPPEGNFV